MKIVLAFVGITALFARGVYAQTAAEYATTCATLARLTEDALKRDDRSGVMVYVNAAALIRRQLNAVTTCEADYFKKVISQNEGTLSTAAVVVSSVGMRPVKGWKHNEINDLFTLMEATRPSDALGNLSGIPTLKLDVEKLKRDMQILKPDVTSGNGSKGASGR